jgi:hypothetical protein
MTTDVTNDSAQGGAQGQPQNPLPNPLPQGEGAGAAVQFSAEQQAAVDKLIAERLKRAQEKWQNDQKVKAQADTDAAEAQRLKDEQKWQELARKHEGRATDLDGKLQSATAELEKATGLITSMLEGKKKGLPEPMVKLLDGKGIFEQLEIVEAYLAAQPAGAQRTATTTPTPPAQGGQSDYVKQAIERQQKRATADDPFAAMMKR